MGLEEMDSEVRDSDETDLGGLVESPNVEYRLGGDGLGGNKLGSGGLVGNRLGGIQLGDRESDATGWGATG